jgi:hypothetical protein
MRFYPFEFGELMMSFSRITYFAILSLIIFSGYGCNSRVSELEAELEKERRERQELENQIEPSQSQDPELSRQQEQQEQELLGENTLNYWNSWNNILDTVFQDSDKYWEVYSVSNSLAKSKLYSDIAEQVSSLSTQNVDPALVDLAADAVVLYGAAASKYKEEADILYAFNKFQEENELSDQVGEALVRAIFSDNPEEIPGQMLSEYEAVQAQFTDIWTNNQTSLNELQNQITGELIPERQSLRLRLGSTYERDFPSFDPQD